MACLNAVKVFGLQSLIQLFAVKKGKDTLDESLLFG